MTAEHGSMCMFMCTCACALVSSYAYSLDACELMQHDGGMGVHLENNEKLSIQTVDGLKNQTLVQDG